MSSDNSWQHQQQTGGVLTTQHIYQTQQQQINTGLAGIGGQGYGVSYPWPSFSIPLSININGRLDQIKIANNKHESVKKEEEFINSLHECTKDLLNMIHEIQNKTNAKFEDLAIIDKYVREKMFNNKFEDFINEEK